MREDEQEGIQDEPPLLLFGCHVEHSLKLGQVSMVQKPDSIRRRELLGRLSICAVRYHSPVMRLLVDSSRSDFLHSLIADRV